MARKILIFLVFITAFSAFGQSPMDFLKNIEEIKFLDNDKITGRHFIFLDGDGLVSSSSINSTMMNPIIFGGNISEDTKNDNYKNLKKSNTLGINLRSSISSAHRVDELFGKNSLVFIGFGYRNFTESRFNEDVFKLIFSGNSSLVDKEIDLKNQQFQSYTYSDFHLGFAKKKIEEAKSKTYGFSIGYIKAFKHFNAKIHSGSFYTAPNTYQMSLQSEYKIERSDTNNISIFGGQGCYVNLFYGFDIEKIFSFKISIEDLGIINWKNGLNSEKNIQHTFSGIEINDITKIEESTSGLNNLTDSIKKSIIYPNDIKSYYSILPANMAISMKYKIIDQIGIESLVRIYTNSIRRFECMGMIHIYPFKKILRISPFIYNSGFGYWTPGMELSIFDFKNVFFKIGTYSFEFKKTTYGAYTSIGFKF